MEGIAPRPLSPPVAAAEPAPVRRWLLLCAAAEALGMSVAAAAAHVGSGVAAGPAAALALVVAGGLIEGAALGTAQAAGLRAWRPGLRTTRYVVATVLVAGLGWAATSAPAVLTGDDGPAAPAVWLVVAGGGALGGVMGAVLGAAQAVALGHQVRHAWRWTGANALAWVPAMALIFLGADLPGADWPVSAVVGTGALTGVAAGAVLGTLLGWSLPSLDGAAPHNRCVLAVLGSAGRGAVDGSRGRTRPLSGSLVGLRVRGVVSGRWMELPVRYAADRAGLVVLPANPDRKRWWRNLRTPTAVAVLYQGVWRPGEGLVLLPADPGYTLALATYRCRWPTARMPVGSPLVRIRV